MIGSRAVAGGVTCLRYRLQPLSRVVATSSLGNQIACQRLAPCRPRRHNGSLAGSSHAPALPPDPEATDQGSTHIRRETADQAVDIIPRDSRNADLRTAGSYVRKNPRLLLKTETLAVNILGRPAEAIVVTERDSKPWKPPAVAEAANEHVPAEALDIIRDSVRHNSGAATIEETRANIDELCPGPAAIIPSREFDAIAAALASSFTTHQLVRYINDYQSSTHAASQTQVDMPPLVLPGIDAQSVRGATDQLGVGDGQASAVGAANQPWIIERLPWIPETPEGRSHSHPLLDGYVSALMRPKDVVIVRLLRECWGLSTREMMDGQGHLDIRVRDPEFSLLLVGGKRWLQAISRVLLNKVGGRMELRRSDGLVRIVAPKAAAETALDQINQVLRATVTRQFDLRLLAGNAPPIVDQAALQELGRLTDSHVCVDRAGSSVSVSWVEISSLPGRDPPEQSREDPHDMVFRLLLTTHKRCQASSSLVVLPHQPDQHGNGRLTGEGRLVVDHRSGLRKLPWADRLGSWARWARPCSPASESSGESNGGALARYPESGLLHWPLDQSPLNPPPQTEPFASPIAVEKLWSRVSTSSCATFGHVLHSLSRADAISGLSASSSTPPSTRTTLDPSSPRVLYPITPPLFSSHLMDSDPPNYYASTSLLLRLLPSPRNAAGMSAPDLELRLHAPEGRSVASIISLTAVRSSHLTDILLPDQPVDVRLVQKRVSGLLGAHVTPNSGMAPLLEFVSAAHLSVADGVFHAPPVVAGLSLPASLLQGPLPGKPRHPVEDGATPTMASVDYLFGGVEVRRHFAVPSQGWSLVHTSIEAGQAGGSRSELSLVAEPWDGGLDDVADSRQSASSHFLDTVLSLAQERQFQWVL